ncbi:Alkaline phosphatase synthesis sensor protein PhoR [Acaryochloris thomasi RCC1774]|uniref:histidine kinase n=1 Tax=Acaryochloris thomasi RCC1774 TaxID=1764569 RepID=A0A2W1JM76_9CYAN|nr:ATP-binding protein [Acaryochloris thomasi]PZD74470.1 Alkaline phosphatase synthesis sensor protein PhoR [Acaryochloris thomasi RCC1774]
MTNPEENQRQRFRHLFIVDDAEGRRTISLEAATYSIGRDVTNSIVLHSKMVSRQHAILLRVTAPETSNYLFRIIDGDLQGKRSTNGLIVNGRRLFSHDLKHGDVVVFGGDVKAQYFVASNLSDEAFDEFRDTSDLSTILKNSVNPFQTLVPTDADFQDMSEAALVRLASFPELTPTPILEIDLSGTVTYMNPSAVMQFENLSEAGLAHPLLEGLLTMVKVDSPEQGNFFVREVSIKDLVFEQSVHYISESDLIRSYITDITERKRAEEQLRHQAQREAIINRIVQAMRGTMVTAEVLDITVGLLLEALGASHCLIVPIESESDSPVFYASDRSVERPDLVQANERFLRNSQDSLAQGQQVVFESGDTSLALELQAICDQCQIQTLLLTPLLYMQRYLGSISLYQCGPSTKEARQWNLDELNLVETIANQCAIAVHQAQLYRQVQDLNTDLERQVEERTAQLQQKMQELERLNILKDDFLSTVSHELRTPMSNIKMAIHMLNQFPLEDRQTRYVKILEAECSRETELINDLLDLQRLEADTEPMPLEMLVLSEWLAGVLEPFQSRARDRKQHLNIHCDPEAVAVQSNRVSLERILAELLNNACKYTPDGGDVYFNIERLQNPDPFVRFQVTNQAEIPASELPRIFDKFYRVPNADPWKQGGTGLGLALVEKLVEQLQGNINVTSSQGQTTFTIELPQPETVSVEV